MPRKFLVGMGYVLANLLASWLDLNWDYSQESTNSTTHKALLVPTKKQLE
jgi:hypothetical protein